MPPPETDAKPIPALTCTVKGKDMEETIFCMAMLMLGIMSMDEFDVGMKKRSSAKDGLTEIVADIPREILSPAISNSSPKIGIFTDALPKIFMSSWADTHCIERFLSISTSPSILTVPPIDTFPGPMVILGVFSVKLPKRVIFPLELNAKPREIDGMNEKFPAQKFGMVTFLLNMLLKSIFIISEIS